MSARSISPAELRPADILVSTGRSFISGAIRTATGSDYSHTILYIGDNMVIEAISEGVVERALNLPLSEASLVVALRRRYMSEQARQFVIQSAKDFRWKPYDYIGAAGAGLSHRRGKLSWLASPAGTLALYLAAKRNANAENRDKMFFCSELVARCYELAGVPINDGDPSFTTPRAVRVAANLLYVGHLVGGP
jgi:cell wall-associated NlpC family hydrolase